MKTLLTKYDDDLNKMHDRLTEEREKREEIFANRSEKWQESPKGQAYQEQTNSLESAIDYIEDVRNMFEEALKDSDTDT